jgi:tetratricopeptide (TPR) repeat protein
MPARRRAGVALPGLVRAGALVLSARSAVRADGEYREYCMYHFVRHEQTGRWLGANTPADAVIATHDVGAIAYYSGRRIVDVVGVVLPEAIDHLWTPDYTPYLSGLFDRAGVTHLACYRNWLEVVNIDPLFVASADPEVMEVFPWIPGRTHLVPTVVTAWNLDAYELMRAGRFEEAFALFRKALALDPDNCRTWYLMGVQLEAARRNADAEAAYRGALVRYPGYKEAQAGLARVSGRAGPIGTPTRGRE